LSQKSGAEPLFHSLDRTLHGTSYIHKHVLLSEMTHIPKMLHLPSAE